MNGEGRPSGRERAWAVVRIALGVAQVMGATISFYLLLQSGTSAGTLGAVVLTGLLVVLSKVLFRGA